MLHYVFYTTPQLLLQLQLLHHTIFNNWGEATIATILIIPKNIIPITFRSSCGFVIQIRNLSYRFPIFEISTTALYDTAKNIQSI